MHVIATGFHLVGKETDRTWDEGAGLSLLRFEPTNVDEEEMFGQANPAFIERLSAHPIKPVAKEAKIDRNTIRKVLKGLSVRPAILLRTGSAIKRLSPKLT
jgi:hypothetical protein